jgi:hypothetical protein
MDMAWTNLSSGGVCVMVVAHSTQNPTGDCWNRYLIETRVLLQSLGDRVKRVRVLVLSDGGGPDDGQRTSLNELLRGTSVRIAVVSRSFIARAMIGAAAWVNPAVRAFAPSRLRAALQYLGLEDETVMARRIREVGEGLASTKTLTAALASVRGRG